MKKSENIRDKTKEHKEFLETVLDSMNDAISIIDPKDFTIIDVNQKFLELLAMEREEVVGKPCYLITHHRDEPCCPPDDVCPLMSTMETGRHAEEEHVHYQKDGTRVFVEVSTTPVFDDSGKVSQVIHVARDITARKMAEEKLKNDEERFEALFELSQMHFDNEQELSDYALELAVRLTGSKVGYLHLFDEDENTIGLFSWSKDVMDSCSARKVPHYPMEEAGVWADCVRERKPVIHNDYPNLAEKKGMPEGHFPVNRHMSVPIFDGDKIVAIIGVGNKDNPYEPIEGRQLELFGTSFWTIVKRKRAEDAINKYADELEEANQLKDLFTDILRHDILNPLGVTRMYSDLLEEQERNPEKKEYIKNLKQNLENAIHLVNDASRYSRLESTDHLEQEDLNLKNIVNYIVSTMDPLAAEAGMTLENMVTLNMPVKGNRFIETVLTNLISNAIKYAQDGKRIVVDAVDDGDSWTIRVMDYGEGIDDKYKASLFTRFQRKAKEGVKGHGLGLAIAKRIVELHQGRIWVEDNPEGGAVFCFSIPKVSDTS